MGLKNMFNRIYSDYFMPSRLDEYERIIKKTLELKYKILSVRDFYYLIKNNKLDKSKRYFINRHDVDTDVGTAKEKFNIEKKYNVKASYYFRLSTLDYNFMKEIDNCGSEASYHFEEVAQFCKDNHIKNRQLALDKMNQIKDEFKENYLQIKKSTGLRMETVCSHGDFVNRSLKIVNNVITKDNKLRKELGILCEAYDDDILQNIDFYISDAFYPKYYKPKSVFDVLGKENIICMLSHPRPWRTNWIVNTKDNIQRLYEGIKW